MVSHTDPLLADTDHDSIADATEVAQGGDAGTVPGTAYVVGEGLFAENVRGGAKDADADGLSDHTEQLVGTDRTRPTATPTVCRMRPRHRSAPTPRWPTPTSTASPTVWK